jgi:DNA-binding XRE family transcriptional regulator
LGDCERCLGANSERENDRPIHRVRRDALIHHHMPTPGMRRLGVHLRSVREGKKYTQQMAADIIGTSRQAIDRIENGTQQIIARELIQLASFYGMEAADFQSEEYCPDAPVL